MRWDKRVTHCTMTVVAIIGSPMTVACAPHQVHPTQPVLVRGPSNLTDVGALRAGTPAIEVRNDRFEYVVVYVVQSGMRIELGVVPAMSRRTFLPNESQLRTDAVMSLGVGPRGAAMDQLTLSLHLRSGSIANWTIHDGAWVEQPIVR